MVETAAAAAAGEVCAGGGTVYAGGGTVGTCGDTVCGGGVFLDSSSSIVVSKVPLSAKNFFQSAVGHFLRAFNKINE